MGHIKKDIVLSKWNIWQSEEVGNEGVNEKNEKFIPRKMLNSILASTHSFKNNVF